MSLGLTVGTGAGLLWWYNHEKEQKLETVSREGKSSVVVGQVRGARVAAGGGTCWPAGRLLGHCWQVVSWLPG